MKLGISSGYIISKLGLEKGLDVIKESGFDAIDLSARGSLESKDQITFKSEDELLSHYDNIRKCCEEREIEISQTHGMLTTCVTDEEEQSIINKGSELQIKVTSVLKAPVCVFHSVKLRQWEGVSWEPEFLHSKNVEFFQDFLTPICAKHNVKFGIETHGRSLVSTGSVKDFIGDANVLKENFDRIKSDYKSICLDTGHTNEIVCFGAPTVPETIRILGDAISVLHLHDNEGNYDSHLPPYVGGKDNVNWEDTFDALEEVGYKGVYNYELNLGRFAYVLEDSVRYLGKYLRTFTENKGRVVK